ncbi:tetratricopeptide repeat protein [Spongiivirga sp. MCCC 1A20706]|uniref:tetratricopeptide repeat-containing sensor histidine kinase n=1 Tax=Spongiivirga sp. MCCC 1A20706 TaxID=3160963 RepID=UPI003977BC13
MYRIAFVFFLFLFFSCRQENQEILPKNRVEHLKKLIDSSQYANIPKHTKLLLADSAKNIIKTLPKDTLYNQLAIEVASCYYMIDEWNQYAKATEVFLENAIRIDDTSAIAKAYYNKGLIKGRFLEYDSAYYYYYNANKLYSQLKNDYRVGRASLGMGYQQRRKGDLLGAEASYVNALDAFKRAKDSEFITTCINGLANIRHSIGDFDQAIVYHEEYLRLNTGLENELEKATPFNNLGWDYENKGDYEKAKSYYEKGLALKNLKQKRPLTYGILIDNYAHVRFLQGELNHLPQPYFEALRIADSLNNLNLAISANLNLSEYYNHVGDLLNAKKHALSAYEIGQENVYLEKVPKALRQLQNLTTGDEALSYANMYIRLTDSLQGEERRSRDQFARIRYESDELETKATQLQQQNEKIAERDKWIIIVLISLTPIIILLLIVRWQRNVREKLIIEQKQQKANEEIYQLMLNQQTKLNEGRSIERKRFSKELHDGVLSRLFGVRLSLESMNLNGQNSTKELYVNELQGIEKEIRQISHDLGNDLFQGKHDFVNVVDDLLIRQSDAASWEYELNSDPSIDWDGISNEHKMHIYRIIQEALQNVNKYANASVVSIKFEQQENQISISITDDGAGFNIDDNAKGIGLKNMRSRAQDINADIEITSKKDIGTTITLKGLKTKVPNTVNE